MTRPTDTTPIADLAAHVPARIQNALVSADLWRSTVGQLRAMTDADLLLMRTPSGDLLPSFGRRQLAQLRGVLEGRDVTSWAVSSGPLPPEAGERDRYATLRRLFEDYATTRSVSLDDAIRAALKAATAEQLAAALQATPDRAVEVVGGLRVAGPWVGSAIGEDPGAARHERRSPLGTNALVATNADGWEWLLFRSDAERPDYDGRTYPTAEAAMAAADAALVAAGWSLAGGPS